MKNGEARVKVKQTVNIFNVIFKFNFLIIVSAYVVAKGPYVKCQNISPGRI